MSTSASVPRIRITERNRASRSRPTKKRKQFHRSQSDIRAIKDAILRVVEAERPMTVRQTFYQLVSLGVIEKTENEYKHTVVRLMTQMREDGELPFDWIADSTRWMRKPRTYDNLTDALEQTKETYRRALWNNQDVYVEIWLEKDALSGVLYPVTAEWDVPLMVTRGYPSISYLHGAAAAIAEVRKPAFIYYLGDYDPSGLDITRNVEKGLRKYAPDAEIHFQRVAVTNEQIQSLSLPTRPTKEKDSRTEEFKKQTITSAAKGESVEVDAIPANRLLSVIRERRF